MTTEALLASALDADDAHELLGWLRRLSFVEEGPYGLFPHDLAREVLDADLRWRNPESDLELHRRVRRFIVAQLRQARGLERQRAFFDLLYLHRNNPIMRPCSTGRRSAPSMPGPPARRTGRPTRPRPRPAASLTGTAPPAPVRSWSTSASGQTPTATRAQGRPRACWPPPPAWSG